jgi:hypothetical protein
MDWATGIIAFDVAIGLVIIVTLILQMAGRKKRSPGFALAGPGILVLLATTALTNLSNDHNWPYRQRHALHMFALIPMILAVGLVVVGAVKDARSKRPRDRGEMSPDRRDA